MTSVDRKSILHNTEHYIDEPQDYAVRYSECYGIYKDNVIRAHDFGISDSGVYCRIRKIVKNQDNINSFLSDASHIKVEDVGLQFPIPTLGFINLGTYAIFLQRTHLKRGNGRYRRGFRPDTISGFNPFTKELRAIGEYDILDGERENYMSDEVFMRIAPNLFFPEPFLSFEEALNEVTSFNRLGIAFTPSLAIKIDLLSNRIVLLKNCWIIGDYDFKTIVFNMRVDTFNSELGRLKVPFKEV